MIGALKRAYEGFRGFGDYAFSVPPLDGAFLPNSDLDDAPLVATRAGADNLVLWNGVLVFSSGADLLRGEDVLQSGGAPITALAASDDMLAVAWQGGEITLIRTDGSHTDIAAPQPGSDVTAMAFVPGGLAVTIGAKGTKAADWQVDLMKRGRTGSVWVIGDDGKAVQKADWLAWPNGVAVQDDALIVSCAWDHALVRVTGKGKPEPVLTNLPGYPARIIATDGGYWLTFLSIRNQLVEFVLRERPYVQRMMAEIDRTYWVCPQFAPPASPVAVMQAGAERHHGEMKPWAPSLSYGLIAKLSHDLLPEASLHSRANGNRHGITSIWEIDGALFATSQSTGGVFRVPTGEANQ